jgi:hypothetical protein
VLLPFRRSMSSRGALSEWKLLTAMGSATALGRRRRAAHGWNVSRRRGLAGGGYRPIALARRVAWRRGCRRGATARLSARRPTPESTRPRARALQLATRPAELTGLELAAPNWAVTSSRMEAAHPYPSSQHFFKKRLKKIKIRKGSRFTTIGKMGVSRPSNGRGTKKFSHAPHQGPLRESYAASRPSNGREVFRGATRPPKRAGGSPEGHPALPTGGMSPPDYLRLPTHL